MKKALIMLTIFFMFISCGNTENSVKNDLKNILEIIKDNDSKNLYKYLPTQKLIDEIYLNSNNETKESIKKSYGIHLNSDKIDFLKSIKTSANISLKEWNSATPIGAFLQKNPMAELGNDISANSIQFLCNLEGSKYMLFSFININHKGKNYYIIIPSSNKGNSNEIDTFQNPYIMNEKEYYQNSGFPEIFAEYFSNDFGYNIIY